MTKVVSVTKVETSRTLPCHELPLEVPDLQGKQTETDTESKGSDRCLMRVTVCWIQVKKSESHRTGAINESCLHCTGVSLKGSPHLNIFIFTTQRQPICEHLLIRHQTLRHTTLLLYTIKFRACVLVNTPYPPPPRGCAARGHPPCGDMLEVRRGDANLRQIAPAMLLPEGVQRRR